MLNSKPKKTGNPILMLTGLARFRITPPQTSISHIHVLQTAEFFHMYECSRYLILATAFRRSELTRSAEVCWSVVAVHLLHLASTECLRLGNITKTCTIRYCIADKYLSGRLAMGRTIVVRVAYDRGASLAVTLISATSTCQPGPVIVR
jgi:hypothetical protein